MKWEADEKRGMDVKTPSEQFKWNQLGDLYQWFTDTYTHLSLVELKGKPYPEGGIAPGTPWSEVPEDFECPLCGVGTDSFEEA